LNCLGTRFGSLGGPLGPLCAPWQSLEASAVLGDLLKDPEGPSRTANHAQGMPNGSPKRPLSTPRDPSREPSRWPGPARESPGTDLGCQGAPHPHLGDLRARPWNTTETMKNHWFLLYLYTYAKEAAPQGCLDVHRRGPRTSTPRKAVPVVAPQRRMTSEGCLRRALTAPERSTRCPKGP